jgi:hypothetical protein
VLSPVLRVRLQGRDLHLGRLNNAVLPISHSFTIG